jgi:maltose-binding protein MalE
MGLQYAKIEFGLNISVKENPPIYLKPIEGFKSKSLYQFDSADRQQTLYFKTNDYRIKTYNKTLESTHNENIIRIEIERLNHAHYLPKMKTVADVINKNIFQLLANQLIKKVQPNSVQTPSTKS